VERLLGVDSGVSGGCIELDVGVKSVLLPSVSSVGYCVGWVVGCCGVSVASCMPVAIGLEAMGSGDEEGTWPEFWDVEVG
jgi:hypothetical protein